MQTEKTFFTKEEPMNLTKLETKAPRRILTAEELSKLEDGSGEIILVDFTKKFVLARFLDGKMIPLTDDYQIQDLAV